MSQPDATRPWSWYSGGDDPQLLSSSAPTHNAHRAPSYRAGRHVVRAELPPSYLPGRQRREPRSRPRPDRRAVGTVTAGFGSPRKVNRASSSAAREPSGASGLNGRWRSRWVRWSPKSLLGGPPAAATTRPPLRRPGGCRGHRARPRPSVRRPPPRPSDPFAGGGAGRAGERPGTGHAATGWRVGAVPSPAEQRAHRDVCKLCANESECGAVPDGAAVAG